MYIQLSATKNMNAENVKKTYQSINSLRRHKKNCNILDCDVCEKKFSFNSQLENHKRKEHIKKDFQCDICGKKLSDNSRLKRHKNTQHGERAVTILECNFCRKTYKNSSDLRSHIRLEHGEPFKCELCEKPFGHNSKLRVHEIP